MKALIIEDEPSVASVFREWFEKVGFVVEVTDSKAGADAILDVEPRPEVITVDINLTDIRGDDTIAWVKEIRMKSPNALLLVISGVLKPADGPKLAELGADGSFEKMDVSVEKSWWQKILDTISGVSNQAGLTRDLTAVRALAEKAVKQYNEQGASLRLTTPAADVAVAIVPKAE